MKMKLKSTMDDFLSQDYGERVKMSYAVNGQFLGDAFDIPSSDLDSQPLFPHVLSKNIKFRVNFGLSEIQFPAEPEYVWAANVPVEQRVAGPRRPERREDCEASIKKLTRRILVLEL